jgi:hypothetical protein
MRKLTILSAVLSITAVWCFVPVSRAQYCDFPPKELMQGEHREYRGMYLNEAYGYSVVIPGDLIGYDDVNPLYQHGFGISVGAQPQSYIFVNGEPNSLEFATAGDAATQHLKYMDKHGNRIGPPQISESKLGRLTAAVLFATYTCSGLPERYVVYSIFAVSPDRSQLYEVSLYAQEGRFEQDKAVLGAIVKSWKHLPRHNDLPSAFDKCRIVTSADLADKKAPILATYRVASPQAVNNPSLDLKSNPTARMYRTVLRGEIARGPNFAGHYRVAIWGCGSSCAMFAVVNLNTGQVITPDGFSYTSGLYFGVEDQRVVPGSQSEDWLFGFRKDSKLLVILGDLDEDESREGAFYFVLENEHLRLVHSTPIVRDCENLRDKR